MNDTPIWDAKNPYKLIGVSPVWSLLREQVQRAGDSTIPVLILGETGVGKELIARNIHLQSRRREANFTALNCGSLTDTLINAELFGAEANSYTGAAASTKKGVVELSSGGTLFLDEIGDLTMKGQQSLLRVLQQRAVRRVGGTTEFDVNYRLVSATNVDIKQAVRDGSLRSDFFYRVNKLQFTVPPLRERPEDIPALARYFWEKFHHQYQGAPVKVNGAQNGKSLMPSDQEMRELATRAKVGYDRARRSCEEVEHFLSQDPDKIKGLRVIVENLEQTLGADNPECMVKRHLLDRAVQYGGKVHITQMQMVDVPNCPFSAAAMATLSAYHWPGNVRQLETVVELALINYAKFKDIGSSDIKRLIEQTEGPAGTDERYVGDMEGMLRRALRAGMTIADIERKLIGAALMETRGQKTIAAEMLGINRATLYNKLKEYRVIFEKDGHVKETRVD